MFRIISRNITSWTRYIRTDTDNLKKINDKITNKINLPNKDKLNFNDHRHILKTFDARWNGNMNKEEFKMLTDSYKGNIDSHDNSLYQESLYKKENNYSNHSIQSIVDDYNRRWKKNLTVEEYYKNFK
uniref:Uncharacterized protein n=1 Tax=viral metagenome TaxID=1070528 RepID=A0A6C0C836_9ZZZZ